MIYVRVVGRKEKNGETQLRALEIISNFAKCQCTNKHGDNLCCPVLVAELAIARAKGG